MQLGSNWGRTAMPSPFPGMDPYLETKYWLNFHARLAVEIADLLGPALPPAYVAIVEERTVLADYVRDEDKRVRHPDISILRESKSTYGGSAVAEPPITLSTPMPFEEPYHWVEIIALKDRRLVTAIEIMSHSNKSGRGRDEYLKKRDETLMSTAHLLEIDLLRRGHRIPVIGVLPAAPYYVFLSRRGKRPNMGIWPIQISDRLPIVPVPLDRPDADLPLDLQSAVDSIYKKSNYDRLLDYSEPLPGPLTDSERQWVMAKLSARFSPNSKENP